jgi:protein-S-isoprenylcysteine O-methyltransferase Ste14
MANRMLWVVVRQAPATEDFDFATHAWAGTTTLFLFAVFIGLPALGGFTPKALLLTGFLYYTAVGLSELTGWRWMFSWMERARRRETSRPRRR